MKNQVVAKMRLPFRLVDMKPLVKVLEQMYGAELYMGHEGDDGLEDGCSMCHGKWWRQSMNKSESQLRRALDLLDLVLTKKVVVEGMEKNAEEKLRAMGTVLYWAIFEPQSDDQKKACKELEDFLNQVEKTWAEAHDHQTLNE